MPNVRAGRAYVEFFLKDGPLVKGLRNAQKRLTNFGKSVSLLGGAVGGIGSSVTAGFSAAAAVFQNVGDAAGKAALRTKLTTNEITELGFAAEQTGASMNGLVQGIFRATRRIANAATETGPAVRALDELGLSAENLSQLAPADQFLTLVESLGEVENDGRRAQLAFEIFGDNVRQLTPLLEQGTEGIEALRQQARDFNLSVDPADAKAAEDLGDAWNLLGRTVRGAIFQVGAAVAGPLTQLSTTFAEIVANVSKFVGANRALVLTAAKVGAALVIAGGAITAVGVGVIFLGSVLGGLATILGTMAAVVGALLSPLGALAAVVVVVGASIVQNLGGASVVVDWLRERFGTLVTSVMDGVSAMGAAIARGDIEAATALLWAGLRVAWTTGVAFLNRKWGEWRAYFESIYIDAVFGFADVITRAFAGIETAWVSSVDFLRDTWTLLISTIQRTWAFVENLISTFLVAVASLFTDAFDLSDALAALESDLNTTLGNIDDKQNDAIGGRADARADRLAQIQSDREAALKELEAERQRRQDALANQDNSAVAKAEAERQKAYEEYQAALGRAAGEGAPEVDGDNTLKKRFDDFMAQFDVSLDSATAANNARSPVLQFGGANAALAVGADSQSLQREALAVQKKHLAEQQKTTKAAKEKIKVGA